GTSELTRRRLPHRKAIRHAPWRMALRVRQAVLLQLIGLAEAVRLQVIGLAKAILLKLRGVLVPLGMVLSKAVGTIGECTGVVDPARPAAAETGIRAAVEEATIAKAGAAAKPPFVNQNCRAPRSPFHFL